MDESGKVPQLFDPIVLARNPFPLPGSHLGLWKFKPSQTLFGLTGEFLFDPKKAGNANKTKAGINSWSLFPLHHLKTLILKSCQATVIMANYPVAQVYNIRTKNPVFSVFRMDYMIREFLRSPVSDL